MIVLPHFQHNAVQVHIHEFLQIVLGRQLVALIHFYPHGKLRQNLLFNLSLHGKDDVLGNQSFTIDINTQKIFFGGGKYTLYLHRLKIVFLRPLQF